MSYYSKKFTGGRNASAGFEYQDYCALIALFQFAIDKPFISLTVETLDDFTVLFSDVEMLVQLKKRQLGIADVVNFLEGLQLQAGKLQIYISTSFTEELRSITHKKVQLNNGIQAGRKPSERNKLVRDFKAELRKVNLASHYNKLIRCDFIELPENHLDAVLFFYCSEWLKHSKVQVDTDSFLNELLVLAAKSRKTRGFIDQERLTAIAKKHSVLSNAEFVVEQLYKLKYKKVSEFLRVLGKDNEKVLEQLEDKIKEADLFLETGNISHALEIYHSLSVIYPFEAVFLQCAQIKRISKDYDGAIKYCEKILLDNPQSFDAFFVKGCAYMDAENHDLAISAFKKAYSIRREPAIPFSIAQIYSHIGDIKRALRYYRQCLNIGGNTAEVHLAISSCCFQLFQHKQAIVHVDKAIDLNSELYDAYLLKADILRFFSIYEEAIYYYRRFLVEYPDDLSASYGIAMCMFAVGYSEGVIFFADWLSSTYGLDLNESHSWIDMGWKETFLVTIIPDEGYIIVDVSGAKYKLERKKYQSWISIGASIDDGIYTSLVGKTFESAKECKRILQLVQKQVKLKKVDNYTYRDAESKIKVRVQERTNYVYIEMIFGEFAMVGVTDPGSKNGFKYFLEGFRLNKIVTIRIGSEEVVHGVPNIEMYSIQDVRNVEVEFFKPDSDTQKTFSKATKRHSNLIPPSMNIMMEVTVVSEDEN